MIFFRRCVLKVKVSFDAVLCQAVHPEHALVLMFYSGLALRPDSSLCAYISGDISWPVDFGWAHIPYGEQMASGHTS